MSTNSHIGEQYQNNNDEISLKELILKIREWWRYLLTKWKTIVFFGLLGGALGFTYAYFKKPVYTATTTFVLEDEKGGGMGNLAGLASMAGIDLGTGGGGIFQGDNIMELYKSRTMLQKTLLTTVEIEGKRQTLMERYIAFNKMRENWKEKPELLALNFNGKSNVQRTAYNIQRLRDSIFGKAVESIVKNNLIVAKPDKKLSIIKVDVKSVDEPFSKLFNEELVKNVNAFYIDTKTKKSLANVRILQQKADSVREVMNGAIYAAVAVADATPNLNPTKQVKRVAPAQRAQFSAETNKEVLKSLVQNLELTNIALLKETPLIQTVDLPVFPLKVDKFGYLKGFLLGCVALGGITCLFFIGRRFYFQLISNDK